MSTEKKLTAVEWLHEEMLKGKISMKDILEQAKEKEKKQIIEAAKHGADFENSPFKNAEDYYKQTFKKE